LKLSRTFTRRWGAGQWLAAAAALALLLGAVAVLIASPWEDSEAGPPPPEFFGVSPQGPMAAEDFERLRDAGAGTVRILFGWGSIQRSAGECRPESQTGVCDWTETDEVVGNAAAHGVRVMPVIAGARGFHHEDGVALEPPDGRPPIEGDDLKAWKEFLAAAAARYGPGGTFWEAFREITGGGDAIPIRTWQIWNEQNGKAYWPPEPDAKEYAALLSESSEAIREADPDAEIVLGGLFGTAAVNSTTYLEELYEVEGIEEAFDAIAIHPYSPDVEGIRMQAEWALDAARAAGDPDVGLWVTELGWGSAENGHPLEQGEGGQAQLLSESFELLEGHREDWNVRGVVWFTWQDREDQEVCEFCRNAGLFDAAGEPKPAWSSFQDAVGR
jgi:Glycosyl hydrolase catalytic core